jgi:2-polyprenyl-3-methyl-5-hydroxy-6-metoxy-1,4-benzoquinol methylase
MTTRDYRTRLYESYFSTSYGQANSPDDAGYRSAGRGLAQLVLPYLPTNRDADIVDAACGIGYAVEMLRNAGYKRVKGIDVSSEQVAVAKKRGLPVSQADVFEYLADSRDSCDVVLALDFIEHLDRDELLAFLDLVSKALRPRGRLVVKTPNASSLFGARTRYHDLTHEQSFTEKSLRSVFPVCGLRPILITGERLRPFTVKGWIRWAPAKTVRLLWKAYLIAELGPEGFSIPTEFNLLAVAERP